MNLGKLSLLEYLKEDKAYLDFINKKTTYISSVEALAILASLSFKSKSKKMFFLFKNIYEATAFNQFLGDYLNEDEVYFFPNDDVFHTSSLGISYEMKDERQLALSSIYNNKPSILVSHVSASKLNISSKEIILKNKIAIKKGDFINVDDFINKLVKIGYIKTDHISQTSQFARRGMIIDIYDPGYDKPFRIELFGDEIDDIRFFNITDELTTSHIDEITIYPCQLRLLDETATSKLKQLQEKEEYSKDDNYKEIVNYLSTKVIEGYLSENDARFFSLLNDKEDNLLSYLEGYDKYLFDKENILEEEIEIKRKEKAYFNSSYKEGISLKDEKIYIDNDLNLDDFTCCLSSINDDELLIRGNGYKAISYQESYLTVSNYLKDGYKIRVALSEPSLSNFATILKQNNIPYSFYPNHGDVMLYDGKITHGFEVVKYKRAYLSSKEIFGISDQRSRFLSRYKEAKLIRRYEDIKVGDYVVHEKHGIGRYLGVEKINSLEYLKIEYANNAFFFLPLNQYKLIRKFSSKDGYTPSLDKMGGSTWARKKASIRNKISYIADQLLEIYSQRASIQGYQFKNDESLETLFMNCFAFKHTDSQLQAIEEIKKDMNSIVPMDRLIAGDVGFGKTEVAFTSAFKAILNNKQVAFLCPTTILSMQHYKVALNRFKDFGVRICLFNRYVSLKEQRENIKLIEEGKIDLVIGTHKILSDDIKFKDLGLLIVDEEQKFGVTHKEKIKAKTTNIDCLTLTATPIPRTLEISLLNVKSLSLLKEPPVNRMPVKTYVTKYNFDLIIEVLEKELNRNGQVYFLHNNISTIESTANKIQKKFKDKTIAVCHAKMNENEIEDVMNKFYSGYIDILICTSIIESGLDIPNVNTIIIEDADHFGLASLYQIKGRVGRSDRLAYAYFFFKDEKKLTDTARKRLKALTDFSELGSGYKIAMQDLNIRGAGDILGARQSGFVDSLGYDAYIELLNEVIREKKFKDKAIIKREDKYELTFSLDNAIPSSYVDEKSRISMYQEISSCTNSEDLINFSSRIKDIYGKYPREVNNLIKKREIEIFLNDENYVSLFKEKLGLYEIVMSKTFSNRENILNNLKSTIDTLNIKLKVKLVDNLFAFELIKTSDYLDELLLLIHELERIYNL